jgi:hypothetical protein
MSYFIIEKEIEDSNKVEGRLLSEIDLETSLSYNIYKITDMSKVEEVIDEPIMPSVNDMTSMMPQMLKPMEIKHQIDKQYLDHIPVWEFKINQIADELHDKAENMVAQGKVSQKQIERYDIKYKKALEGDENFFKEEVEMLKKVDDNLPANKKTPKKLMKLVKNMGDVWSVAIENKIKEIEAVRVSAKTKIKTLNPRECMTLYKNIEAYGRGEKLVELIFELDNDNNETEQ